ncbi:hypothetical protein IEU95_07280 [Hoyosella rhizosphaerae]|uniref:Carboxypeptidase regulatory-like domain-containing protein n=1 Tax=Hoyosella rhizosphaerae TaxID=1755582 RepID=A0A916U2D7_9ACTN|nr:hypothetical protein [Hoyosella rhizosphaerae]MBN4926625.1 hypothetical protein [Hoyosella rhizosphaerae]GGC57745.1 hypothetical protein GCM10011410_07830 [Hoyosella rhizosphaerae]
MRHHKYALAVAAASVGLMVAGCGSMTDLNYTYAEPLPTQQIPAPTDTRSTDAPGPTATTPAATTPTAPRSTPSATQAPEQPQPDPNVRPTIRDTPGAEATRSTLTIETRTLAGAPIRDVTVRASHFTECDIDGPILGAEPERDYFAQSSVEGYATITVPAGCFHYGIESLPNSVYPIPEGMHTVNNLESGQSATGELRFYDGPRGLSSNWVPATINVNDASSEHNIAGHEITIHRCGDPSTSWGTPPSDASGRIHIALDPGCYAATHVRGNTGYFLTEPVVYFNVGSSPNHVSVTQNAPDTVGEKSGTIAIVARTESGQPVEGLTIGIVRTPTCPLSSFEGASTAVGTVVTDSSGSASLTATTGCYGAAISPDTHPNIGPQVAELVDDGQTVTMTFVLPDPVTEDDLTDDADADQDSGSAD